MLSNSTVAINKVRVSGRHGDPLSLRLRLGRVLSSIDLTPRGLPPTAIVCFKRVRDPRPGLLDLSSRSLQSTFEWERALKEHLADLISRAPRTAADRKAAWNADCVIFLDEADLLASLASDWCREEIQSRWWWPVLLKGPIVGRRELVTRWRDAPEHVPAALERLGPRKIEFVQKLSDAEADALLEVVVRRFALHAIAPVAREPGVINEPVVVIPREAKFVAHRVATPAPWRKFIIEIRNEQLSLAQERFLGVSLMLLRAPAVVRTRKFATEMAIWQRIATEGFVEPSVRVTHERLESQAPTPTTTKTVPATASTVPDESPAPFRSVLNPITPLPTGREIKSVKSVVHESEPDVFFENTRIESVAAVPREEIATTIEEKREEIEVEVEARVAEEVVRSVDAIHHVEYVPVTETNFAGVFYLVNLGIYLGLYGDFTMPAEPGIELNIWDFVALAGRELIGDEIEDDPVWSLLADLAGREDSLEPMQPWLTELMPSVRRRLRAALGLDETIDPGPLLIAHSGRVRVTETHIDVFLLLAELPIAIRFAGLDRDPGWVPAAGRFIAFHFE